MRCRTIGLLLCLTGLVLRASPVTSPVGYVIEWGWNFLTATPVEPTLVCSNAVAVAVGDGHRLALLSNGTVFGWGGNFWGEATGQPTTNPSYASSGLVKIGNEVLSNVVSIAAGGNFCLAVKKDGMVVTWGMNRMPQGLTNAMTVAAGYYSSWVLRRDGTIIGWDSAPHSDSYGRLLQAGSLSNVVAIAYSRNRYPGVAQGVALHAEATVSAWGDSQTCQYPPPGLSNVVSIAAGDYHFLALKKDGTIVGWGGNRWGEATGVPTPQDSNLRCYAAGMVRFGEQPLSNIVAIAAGPDYSIALRADGTLVAWGRMCFGRYPVIVPEGLSNVVAIAGGENACLAITTNWSVAKRFLKSR